MIRVGQEDEKIQRKETSVRQAELDHAKALRDGDVASLDWLISTDYTHTQASGATTTKAGFLQAMRAKAVVFETFELEELLVRFFGEVAVVTGRYYTDVRTSEGLAPRRFAYFTRVWARENGRWVNVAHQATEAPQG